MPENTLKAKDKDDSADEQASDAGSSRVAQKAEEIKDKVSDYGDRAKEGLEDGKTKAAEALNHAADAIRERTGDGMLSDAGESLASGVEKVAAYTEERSPGEMRADLEDFIKKHPVEAVAGAIFAGFLIGKVMR